ncbi:ExbD/TolR family protein [Solitalea canadensis]|uniref:Biopolymer transport protein n=1 Tax=Solitalea canadensis (strain ATCC 29591 / DSM 3403 / JCM 21819 / LMG 8368 / NBRC 15130 / NCIMB 12057 / USAM 9D) TaxID=929556 RepID=H8KMF0_SOLCM|nr:biopolymer transporter ExbD [Solitalea canadensis]AFD08745.1 biopolymer transport protein [Solitalea canadensis DSM 3403]
MADIDTSGGGGKHKGGKKRGKKLSTRVDFTPMVDLGFLLITFFMLTTSMSKPSTMEINMPFKDEKMNVDDQTKIKESQAMTILLTGKDQIVYYFGIGDKVQNPLVTDYSRNGIRKILLEESKKRNPSIDSISIYRTMLKEKRINEETYKKNVSRIKAFKDGIIVLIKSDDKSRYKNLVDILDEMNITNIGRYAIVDIAPGDLKMINENPYVKK